MTREIYLSLLNAKAELEIAYLFYLELCDKSNQKIIYPKDVFLSSFVKYPYFMIYLSLIISELNQRFEITILYAKDKVTIIRQY